MCSTSQFTLFPLNLNKKVFTASIFQSLKDPNYQVHTIQRTTHIKDYPCTNYCFKIWPLSHLPLKKKPQILPTPNSSLSLPITWPLSLSHLQRTPIPNMLIVLPTNHLIPNNSWGKRGKVWRNLGFQFLVCHVKHEGKQNVMKIIWKYLHFQISYVNKIIDGQK